MRVPKTKRKLLVPMALTAAQVNAVPIEVKGKVPTCRWIHVTPELAMKWLDESNQNNRTIRESHVRDLAADMTEGRWRGLNGEAIRFDSTGRLVDGQHRMWACVVADVAFDTLVVYDVAAEDYSTIGIGRKKSLGDFLGPNHGEKNVYLLASTIRVVHFWSHGMLAEMGNGGGTLSPTISELEITYRDHPNIRDSVNLIACMTQTRKLYNATYATLIHYAGTLENRSASVHSFLERLGSGIGLDETDPVYKLREKLLAEQTGAGHRKPGRKYMLAIGIKAWNASKRGQHMKTLNFKVGETFPVL